MAVDLKTRLLGRIAPIVGLTGLGLVSVGVGVLSDGDESVTHRLLWGALDVALVVAFASMVPAMLRYFRD